MTHKVLLVATIIMAVEVVMGSATFWPTSHITIIFAKYECDAKLILTVN